MSPPEATQLPLDAFPHAPAAPAEPFAARDGFVAHPLLRPEALDARPYQTRLAKRALEGSLLVVLPTGLGKTAIAVLAAAELLRRDEGAQVVVLAPTRPLVLQHAALLRLALDVDPARVVALTGRTAPARRAQEFTDARVVVSTPQGLANDVAAERVRLDRVALLVVDEAHRSVGGYAYVPLVEAYRAQRDADARVLALTASPGGRRARVREVVDALGVARVEACQPDDPDVAPYVKETLVGVHAVPLPPEMRRARDELDAVLRERVQRFRAFVPRRTLEAALNKKALLETGEAIRKKMAGASMSQRGYCFGALYHHGIAMQALHAIEVLETQGLHPLQDHLERMLARDPKRAQKAFLKDARVMRALEVARATRLSHPKESALLEALHQQFARKPESLVLVFAQYRDTVRKLVARVREAGFAAERFVGQGSRAPWDEGLTQEEQAEALRRFARGDTRVLVATSVAEEGLHVPAVDLVVFYEPVPSEIRTIQRRGRTGRDSVGRVLVLVTEGTRDARFLHVEALRETSMRRVVGELGRKGVPARAAAPRHPRDDATKR